MSRVVELVCGGQTGVNRAALDAALERYVPCGGWGRRSTRFDRPRCFGPERAGELGFGASVEKTGARKTAGVLVRRRPRGGLGVLASRGFR
jgi:hypothetical protein